MKLKTLAVLLPLFFATQAMAADTTKANLSTDKQKLTSYLFLLHARDVAAMQCLVIFHAA